MLTTRHLAPLTLVGLLALPSCSWFGGDSAEKPAAPRPSLVGRIASIPPHRRFVLIESYGKWEVATGAVLTTRGTDGRTANLRVTGESVNQYAAADLQAGTAEVGDAVFQLPKPAAPTPATPVEEPTPAADLPPAGVDS